jgi:predicted DCC family thiol-disulfide oxidoreductase YuxK
MQPGALTFAARGSAAAAAALEPFPAAARADALIVVADGRAYVRSDAALAVVARLNAPWPALDVLRFVPRALRDAAYDTVARNRYRWFGRLTGG